MRFLALFTGFGPSQGRLPAKIDGQAYGLRGTGITRTSEVFETSEVFYSAGQFPILILCVDSVFVDTHAFWIKMIVT